MTWSGVTSWPWLVPGIAAAGYLVSSRRRRSSPALEMAEARP